MGLLYDVFVSGTPVVGEGLRFRLLTHGMPGPVRVLTNGESGDGASNSEQLWFDRDGRGTVIYTRGDYPDTDYAWVEQRSGLADPLSGGGSGERPPRAGAQGGRNERRGGQAEWAARHPLVIAPGGGWAGNR